MFQKKYPWILVVLMVGLWFSGCTTAVNQNEAAATGDEVAETLPTVAPTAVPVAETIQPAEPSPTETVENLTPQQLTANFYNWYLSYIGDRASDDFRNPLVDQAYHDTPYLSDSFVGHVDQLLADMRQQGGGGYDPFLCAQDIPTAMEPEVAFIRNGLASVVVSSSFPNHLLTVDLRPEGESWLISNITCANGPAGVAINFYTWYLGYIGDRASGDFRNPLVDKAYQGHPLLTESFTQEVDDLLASSTQGGYDPFLLAQDIPQDFSVDPGVVANTAVVHLQFGPDSVRHLLVTMDDTGRRITAITEDSGLPSAAPVDDEADSSSAAQAVHVSDAYGFSFSYPQEWTLAEMDLQGPGMPDDWPVMAAWMLMPPEVADALGDQSGPPDPNAPVIVAPFNVEVVVGDAQAVARVYFDLADGEPTTINENTAVVLQSDPGYSHVIFAHPQRPATWVVFTDWVTTFPGREAQAETAAPAWLPLLESLQFAP